MNETEPLDEVSKIRYLWHQNRGDWKQGTDAKDVHFYYTEKRNHVFESLMANAENIGEDVPLMKGIKHEVRGFDPEAVKETIETPILYRNVLKLTVKKEQKTKR